MSLRVLAGFIILIILLTRNKSSSSTNNTINQNQINTGVNGATIPTAANAQIPNPVVATTTGTTPEVPAQIVPAVVDPDFFVSEDKIIKKIITQEIEANGKSARNISTRSMQRRKIINALLFALITFICISFYFFHFPMWTYLIELVVIFVYITINRKYSALDFLYKEVKARPDEKVSNIVASSIQENVTDTFVSKLIRFSIIVLPFIAATIVYSEPHFLYEKAEDGYHVRFYTISITNPEEIVVPEEYKGQPITGIRGNVFANLKYIRKITLPDTINEIRGNAFKNDYSLEEINLPKDLIYLGGNAFLNCHELKEIVIPEGVTEIQGGTFVNCYSLKKVELHDNIEFIHGESFINCQALEEIKLPSKITEIRGNTFQGCYSLKSIEIPEGVTRIGGHAFEDCSSLSSVTFPKTIKEIGSSAFRRCTSLKSVTIPRDTIVADNAFKENFSTKISYLPNSSPSGKEYKKYDEIPLYIGGYGEYIYINDFEETRVQLVGVENINGYNYQYIIELVSDSGTKRVDITLAEISKVVNSDMEIEIVNSSSSNLTIGIYYN